jgi:hypothetical protein
MIYGSGLRDGDANISTVPPYTQFNIGIARVPGPLDPEANDGALRRRQSVRHGLLHPPGSGIGVFAPQYGPRRAISLCFKKFERQEKQHASNRKTAADSGHSGACRNKCRLLPPCMPAC